MIQNESAKKLFDCSAVDDIAPDNEYKVCKKTDLFGRDYYGVANFWNVDNSIKEDCDLSWLEWDGNEVNIDNEICDDISSLFRKTVGIIKSWELQLKELCPEGRFAILASYDDGSALIEESDPYFGFTLRFWKIREGQGPDIKIEEYNEPVMIMFLE
ncbi:MAG: hypothetical protein IKN56_06950 [Clostridia bacterium]|nr:hypothetical protein [Clostridia bacterium]